MLGAGLTHKPRQIYGTAAPRFIGRAYDDQAAQYAAFADSSFAWRFIERPAFDARIPDLYRSDVRVLDVGCGTGLVIKHLISKGILSENIVGVDLSAKLLERARRNIPEVRFIRSSMDRFKLPNETFDLVTSNMAFHHLGNLTLTRALNRFYDALKPDGTLFFIDTDPAHNAAGWAPKNRNKWLLEKTPWGTYMPYFNRDLHELLLDTTYFAGFDVVSGRPLKVVDEAWSTLSATKDGVADAKSYLRYASHPSRIFCRLGKIPPKIKSSRRRNKNWKIPSLI